MASKCAGDAILRRCRGHRLRRGLRNASCRRRARAAGAQLLRLEPLGAEAKARAAMTLGRTAGLIGWQPIGREVR